MMSTLNRSDLSGPNLRAPTPAAPPALPEVSAAQNKRFANIMAKTRAMAPPVVSRAPARPIAAENAHPAEKAEPSTEASRAEANARSNAKAAARLLANRDINKAQGPHATSQTRSPTDPSEGPQRTPDDNAAPVRTPPEDKAAAAGSALSADMAAWVAALNPVASPPATHTANATGAAMAAERSLANGEAKSAADSKAADLASTLSAQADAQDLRKAADAAAQAEPGAMPGSPGMLGTAGTPRNAGSASDSGRSPAAPEADRSAGRDGRRGELRGVLREFNGPGADTQAPLAWLGDIPGNAQGNVQADTSASGPASAATANASTDFSALLANSLNGAGVLVGGPHRAQPVLTLSLPTPLNAPEFREALGLQISLLARDGVQTAELHLNPAEMGPVSIQIVMDGSQARVDFGADAAATRAALEAGMPELASALLEAGFTLAGGGVSQHAKGQNQPAAPGNPSSGGRNGALTAADVARTAAALTTRRVQLRAGGVDLFA